MDVKEEIGVPGENVSIRVGEGDGRPYSANARKSAVKRTCLMFDVGEVLVRNLRDATYGMCPSGIGTPHVCQLLGYV